MTDLRQLTRQDVMFVGGETDTMYQHTGGLVLLDVTDCPGFGYESFRQHLEQRLAMIPHFRWKLHEVPMGLDLPYWVEDEHFSFDHHFKRIAVPSPGDREALAEVVAHLYSKHLDRSRPLWEIWFIEGLADGRCALLQKLHHCMMDGQGASKLAEIMCDFEPGAKPPRLDPEIANAQAGKLPSQWEESGNAARHLARFPGRAVREIVEFAGPQLWRRMSGAKKSSAEKPPIPQVCFNDEISADRGFVFGSVSLEDIKRVKNHFDVTVNDVVLALVGGSLRNYLLARGELPDVSLYTSIAVSLRTEEDDEFSNRVTNTSVTLATDLTDPVARLKRISAETSLAKKTAHGGGKSLIDVMQAMPPLLVSAMVGVTPPEQAPQMIGGNLVISNVRGSDRPMYIGEARMATMYPMSIIAPGMGINITCVSYAGRIDFGVTIDPELVPDPWFLVDDLQRALEEFLALVKKPSRSRRKPAARKKAAAKKKPAPRRKAAAKKRPAAKAAATRARKRE